MLKSLIYGVVAFALINSPAFAHGGHDHGHWTATPVHFVGLFAIVAVAFAVRHALKNSKAKQVRAETNQ